MPHIPNPTILEREGQTERAWDIYSRLFKERIIYLGTPINDDVANLFVAQLLFLSGDDPDRDIQIHQQPRQRRYRRPGDVRRDAARQAGHLHRLPQCLQHGLRPARRGHEGETLHSAQW